MKGDTYKGLPIYSLGLNHSDRFCYCIDDSFNITIIDILNVNSHYKHISESIRSTFAELREACITKNQKIAFNQLLNSFKFKVSR